MANTITLEEWAETLEKAGGGGLKKALTHSLRRFAFTAKSRAKRNATRSPRVRSGRLRSSIRFRIVQDQRGPEVHLMAGGTPGGGLGSGSVTYARLQEEGGEVRPRAGRFLRVPLPAALTGAGVDRYAGVPLRQVGGFFVIRGPSGKLVLMRKTGKTATPWYVLVDSVKVKGSHFLRKAIHSSDALAKLEGPLADAFTTALLNERV